MKTFGPGLLFVGSLKITVSVTVLVTGLFIFYTSSCFRLGRLYFSKNLSISSSSVQLLGHVRLFATSWTTTCQVSLSITNSCNLLKLKSIELVIPSNHHILCCPLFLLPSIFPASSSFPVSVLCIRWPKY